MDRLAHHVRMHSAAGGTDVGVIQLVSGIMHRYHVPVPIIGVCALRCVNGREKMERRRSIDVVGRDVHYSNVDEASGTGAPLNPYHTHFLLVDDGSPEVRCASQ